MQPWKAALWLVAIVIVALPAVPQMAQTVKNQPPYQGPSLDRSSASRFADLALRCVGREYPYKPDHVLGGEADMRPPREFHPAFYGCYDWHSAVHGHWMLASLLRQFPDLPEASRIKEVLDRHLSPKAMQSELSYLATSSNRAFERPYGWAWLLKLSAELETPGFQGAVSWAQAVRPLAEEIRGRFMDFLPKLTYPNRTGVHSNTAYAIALALDYARAVTDTEFEALLLKRAAQFFTPDKDAPLGFEPGGEDFLSPALEEAALMAKVMPQADFRIWLKAFLPKLRRLPLTPATVSDRSDPRIVHLDGLNMSRARNLYTLMTHLPAKESMAAGLMDLADAHALASLPHVAGGNYEGEHWLATFAVHMLEARGN